MLHVLVDLFEQHRDQEKAIPMQNYMKNHFPFLGIKTPERRSLVKQFFVESGILKTDFQTDFILALWKKDEREYQYAALDYLEKSMKMKRLEKQHLPFLEQLITSKSWWDTVDIIAPKLLGSWNFFEMLFLYAVAILSWGFCVILFLHFRSLDTYILNGTFDRFLVRPINPFFHFMAMKFDMASFGQFIFSLIIFIWVSLELHIEWSSGKVLFLLASIIGGILIQGGMLVLISAIAFWTTKSQQFYWVVMYPARNLTNYPLVIYPKIVQWIAAFVVPFGFVNYFPAAVILEKGTPFFPESIGYFSPLVGLPLKKSGKSTFE